MKGLLSWHKDAASGELMPPLAAAEGDGFDPPAVPGQPQCEDVWLDWVPGTGLPGEPSPAQPRPEREAWKPKGELATRLSAPN